uniref:peptidylprolyl isomerase n=1 Tax=Chromera velia CCMP2878 TaxID=1169474 RepID=A0A0G4FZH0_9ALVE|eukprot:Cvel_19444.t1-p1 / transcript=Cvel_19444.t1 / gene=Cvel_19444 / organism=Chromera_velia_CCMP2878 / gene_product=FK506-binding protein 59, putative / transcript_product=FK506-binding protein 59, putative / location=Cvel_scaffold1677:9107-16274(+) / protein_length=661 / sequence_SO=supercontig / SO=protein_coding / is_pseudo=false
MASVEHPGEVSSAKSRGELSASEVLLGETAVVILEALNTGKKLVLPVSELYQGEKTVGRRQDNDFMLSAEHISCLHCKFQWTVDERVSGTGDVLRNLELLLIDESSNGTFVDNNRIPKGKPVRLGDGQTVSFAKQKCFDDGGNCDPIRVHVKVQRFATPLPPDNVSEFVVNAPSPMHLGGPGGFLGAPSAASAAASGSLVTSTERGKSLRPAVEEDDEEGSEEPHSDSLKPEERDDHEMDHPLEQREHEEEETYDICGDGTVMKTVLVKGTVAESPSVDQEVTVNYVGRLRDIQGEKCRVILAPGKAYGARGAGDKIPPNCTLEFEIELVSWINEEDMSPNLDGSLLMMKTKAGEGWQHPRDLSRVKLQYVMKVREGQEGGEEQTTTIRDTYAEGAPHEFVLDDADDLPIAGFDCVVRRMKKGQEGDLIIAGDSEFAFRSGDEHFGKDVSLSTRDCAGGGGDLEDFGDEDGTLSAALEKNKYAKKAQRVQLGRSHLNKILSREEILKQVEAAAEANGIILPHRLELLDDRILSQPPPGHVVVMKQTGSESEETEFFYMPLQLPPTRLLNTATGIGTSHSLTKIPIHAKHVESGKDPTEKGIGTFSRTNSTGADRRRMCMGGDVRVGDDEGGSAYDGGGRAPDRESCRRSLEPPQVSSEGAL